MYIQQLGGSAQDLAPYMFACILPTIGFLGAFVVSFCYRRGWLTKRKYIVLNVIELSYLLYIFAVIWSFQAGKLTSLVLLRVKTSSDSYISCFQLRL